MVFNLAFSSKRPTGLDINSFIELSPIAILRLAPNGEIVEANASFRKLLQGQLPTNRAVQLIEFIEPDDRPKFQDAIDSVMKSRGEHAPTRQGCDPLGGNERGALLADIAHQAVFAGGRARSQLDRHIPAPRGIDIAQRGIGFAQRTGDPFGRYTRKCALVTGRGDRLPSELDADRLHAAFLNDYEEKVHAYRARLAARETGGDQPSADAR